MEYKVEKLVNDKWHYEGQGKIDYVNRIAEHFVKNEMIFKMIEVRSKNSIALNILNTCLELKEYGVDAFFSYRPHVDWFDVDIYTSGWKANQKLDYTFSAIRNTPEELKKLEEEVVRILMEVKNEK